MSPGVLYGIGAQKAGTSWLFQALRRHPQIAFPLRKEAHYWDWVELKKRPRMDDKYWESLETENVSWVADFTPDYSILSAETITSICTQRPQTRVLLVLRDPAERAWSAARMLAGQAHFETDELDDAWLSTICRSRASFRRGNYASIVENWFASFPPSQIKVFGFADVVDRPGRVVCDVLKWLGLDPAPVMDQPLPRAANVAIHRPIPEAMKVELVERYRPSLAQLPMTLRRYAVPLDIERWSVYDD